NAPAASGGYFADKEQEAFDEAKRASGSGSAQSADPAALAAMLRGAQPRVIGMTRGGFQPTTRGETAQTESKVMPPEWKEALAHLTMHGKAAAEGNAAVQSEGYALQARAAERRAAMLQQSAEDEQAQLAMEDRARQAAEQRIQLAMQDFAQSAPRAEN